MTYRAIDEAQANAVLKILVEECGHHIHDTRDAHAFVHAILTPNPHSKYVCQEFRFGGELGFGGKFRNNGNHDNTPYVDCYQENETPKRLAMIEAANKRLAALFEKG